MTTKLDTATLEASAADGTIQSACFFAATWWARCVIEDMKRGADEFASRGMREIIRFAALTEREPAYFVEEATNDMVRAAPTPERGPAIALLNGLLEIKDEASR